MTTGGVIRIAIADDHQGFREGLHAFLSLESDFQVVAEASNGQEVLELLPAEDPDILLLDLRMSQMNGLATLKAIQLARTKTKILVLSSSEAPEDYSRAVEYGACQVVPKSEATRTLIPIIRETFNARQAVPTAAGVRS